MQVNDSRRQFLGKAAAGVAALGTMSLLSACGASGDSAASGIATVQGTTAMAPIEPGELGAWQAMVGRTVTFLGTGGSITATVSAVEAGTVMAGVPAGSRTQPFSVGFVADAYGMAAGDRVYAMGNVVSGSSELYLQRSANAAGKAVLTALFA